MERKENLAFVNTTAEYPSSYLYVNVYSMYCYLARSRSSVDREIQ